MHTATHEHSMIMYKTRSNIESHM